MELTMSQGRVRAADRLAHGWDEESVPKPEHADVLPPAGTIVHACCTRCGDATRCDAALFRGRQLPICKKCGGVMVIVMGTTTRRTGRPPSFVMRSRGRPKKCSCGEGGEE